MSYLQAKINNIIAFVSAITLMALGIVWIYQHCGWFAAGISTAIALISNLNIVHFVYVEEEDE